MGSSSYFNWNELFSAEGNEHAYKRSRSWLIGGVLGADGLSSVGSCLTVTPLLTAKSRAARSSAWHSKERSLWSPRSLCRPSGQSMSPGCLLLNSGRFWRLLSARGSTYRQKDMILDFIFSYLFSSVYTNPGFHNNTHLTNIFFISDSWFLHPDIPKTADQLQRPYMTYIKDN